MPVDVDSHDVAERVGAGGVGSDQVSGHVIRVARVRDRGEHHADVVPGNDIARLRARSTHVLPVEPMITTPAF